MTDTLDHVDLLMATVAVDQLLKAQRERRDHLDQLYTERFYLLTQRARWLRKSGSIDDKQLNQIWSDLDREMSDYDWRLFERIELETYLFDLVRRLRLATQMKRQRDKNVEVQHAAE